MDMLIWVGTAVSGLGLLGILISVVAVLRLRRKALPDAEMRAAMRRLVALNIGAMFVSVLGLMGVVVGILLG